MCVIICATVRALVCVEKCVSSRFEEKRERSQLLLIATCFGCFKDPIVKPCLITATFIEDFSLIFLQSEQCDCLLEVCRSVRNFVKNCCPQDVPVTISLGWFRNPTVKSSPIALKFLLEFYYSQFVVLAVEFEIGAVFCF